MYYKFNAAANMDVYIDRKIVGISTLEALDSINRLSSQSILFVRSKEIRNEKEFALWLSFFKTQWTNGQYSWYLIGNKSSQDNFANQ